MAKKRVISHRDFVRDLGRGQHGEDIVEVFLLREFGLIANNVSDRNPDYDLTITDVDKKLLKGSKSKVAPKRALKKVFREAFGFKRKDALTVEVKLDEAAARYKNFFVEIFFNIDDCSAGTTFKCKADLVAWVVPAKRKKFKIYIFDRAKWLAWTFHYMFTRRKKLEYKTPSISPLARGVAIPITDAVESPACLGVFDFSL